MRTISYTCNRCGKPVAARAVIKINLNMQKGNEPVEKKTYDFCSSCFLHVKSAFSNSLKLEDKTVSLLSETDSVQSDTGSGTYDKSTISVHPSETVVSEKGDISYLTLGPISPEDRKEILRLYVYEKLTPYDIAIKMNRLPRGIKRAINSAIKSGEIDRMQETVQKEDDTIEEMDSDKTKSPVIKDSYTAPPQTVVINGKRYDVGSILALARAGWGPGKIADDKHYDDAVVRVIIEKYM